MNILKVNLWGEEIGRLTYSPKSKLCTFAFNPVLKGNRPDIVPLLAPLLQWTKHPFVYGDDRRIYQQLPPFIADSLPDSWGNKLFEQWAKQNKLSQRSISPLFKLIFIGKRGMGALEFEPAAVEFEHKKNVDISSLYNLSLKILNDRAGVSILPDEELTLQGLLAVGTSAGGRQMKAIITIDKNTGEIRSGQVDGMTDCDYFLLKFEDKDVPTSEIEMSVYEMATAAGIKMEDCRIVEIAGVKHFMTRRFDRKNGKKVHMQTLAAINPEADSYEDLLQTCRALNLSDSEIDELFLRMVFNIMVNNTDDHNKNFSFLLGEGGRWRLSPAYDQTFIFNRFGTDGEIDRCLSLGGKIRDITQNDLIDFAKENGIRSPEQKIKKVAYALSHFREIAEKNAIPMRWRTIMENTIRNNLIAFGFLTSVGHDDVFTDDRGRIISDITVRVNRRGIYEVSVKIDGQTQRRFVRKNMEIFPLFETNEFFRISPNERLEILRELFEL